MLLAIDAGNTHTVLGIFQEEKLLDEWRMASTVSRTVGKFWAHVQSFAKETGLAPEELRGVVISSVVPRLTASFTAMAKKYLHNDPVIVSAELDSGITVLYDDPSKLGADRLCHAVAAYAKFGGPAIVIDFGTATTYDVISAKGEYIGGVIAPGIGTSAQELYRRARKLREVGLGFPESVIGTNTIAGMRSGIMYAAVDAAEGMIRRIAQAIGGMPKVIATGGYAGLVAEKIPSITTTEPSLVLDGARLIYERVALGKK